MNTDRPLDTHPTLLPVRHHRWDTRTVPVSTGVNRPRDLFLYALEEGIYVFVFGQQGDVAAGA